MRTKDNTKCLICGGTLFIGSPSTVEGHTGYYHRECYINRERARARQKRGWKSGEVDGRDYVKRIELMMKKREAML